MALVLVGYIVIRNFTDLVSVTKVEMTWTAGSQVPWGEVGPPIVDGEPIVVLYRRVGDGFCFHAVYSNVVKEHLESQKSNPVIVELNLFSDFGRVSRSTIRSIEGLEINRGKLVIIPLADDESGFVEINGSSGKCW
jgi:hypothetical protein